MKRQINKKLYELITDKDSDFWNDLSYRVSLTRFSGDKTLLFGKWRDNIIYLTLTLSNRKTKTFIHCHSYQNIFGTLYPKVKESLKKFGIIDSDDRYKMETAYLEEKREYNQKGFWTTPTGQKFHTEPIKPFTKSYELKGEYKELDFEIEIDTDKFMSEFVNKLKSVSKGIIYSLTDGNSDVIIDISDEELDEYLKGSNKSYKERVYIKQQIERLRKGEWTEYVSNYWPRMHTSLNQLPSVLRKSIRFIGHEDTQLVEVDWKNCQFSTIPYFLREFNINTPNTKSFNDLINSIESGSLYEHIESTINSCGSLSYIVKYKNEHTIDREWVKEKVTKWMNIPTKSLKFNPKMEEFDNIIKDVLPELRKLKKFLTSDELFFTYYTEDKRKSDKSNWYGIYTLVESDVISTVSGILKSEGIKNFTIFDAISVLPKDVKRVETLLTEVAMNKYGIKIKTDNDMEEIDKPNNSKDFDNLIKMEEDDVKELYRNNKIDSELCKRVLDYKFKQLFN